MAVSREQRTREVVILYKSLPHYRVAFFDLLRVWLADRDVNLTLIVGQPVGSDAGKSDQGLLPWARSIRNRSISLGGRTLIWQPVLRDLASADLVVAEQANKLLVNNALMLWRRLGGPKYALWGHGRNRNRSTASPASEWFKRQLVGQCDWWFSYTASTTAYLLELGVNPARISTVQNAVDVRRLSELAREFRRPGPDSDQAANVALFCGSLYEAKRLDFLFAACELVARKIPEFELLVVGDGPLRSFVERTAATSSWLRYLGPQFDGELARAASRSQVMLMPGLVGLVILDAFAFETPLVTTRRENHSPEIDYLQHGENGWVVDDSDSIDAYAAAVVSILGDDALLEHLRSGCQIAAERYTVEAMVERFGAGVIECLAIV